MPRPIPTLDAKAAARFRQCVNEDGPMPPARSGLVGPCWTWTGPRMSPRQGAESYGRFILAKVHFLAHRVAWTLDRGPIPDGQVVCHACDNPTCVRPSHLFLGTQDDNLADMRAKGRAHYNHFPKGTRHPNAKMTPETVAEVRRLRETGLSFVKIGARVGLHASTVHSIVSGRTWRI